MSPHTQNVPCVHVGSRRNHENMSTRPGSSLLLPFISESTVSHQDLAFAVKCQLEPFLSQNPLKILEKLRLQTRVLRIKGVRMGKVLNGSKDSL